VIAEHGPGANLIIGGRTFMEGWTAANHAAGNSTPRDGALTEQRLGWPMTPSS